MGYRQNITQLQDVGDFPTQFDQSQIGPESGCINPPRLEVYLWVCHLIGDAPSCSKLMFHLATRFGGSKQEFFSAPLWHQILRNTPMNQESETNCYLTWDPQQPLLLNPIHTMFGPKSAAPKIHQTSSHDWRPWGPGKCQVPATACNLYCSSHTMPRS